MTGKAHLHVSPSTACVPGVSFLSFIHRQNLCAYNVLICEETMNEKSSYPRGVYLPFIQEACWGRLDRELKDVSKTIELRERKMIKLNEVPKGPL